MNPMKLFLQFVLVAMALSIAAYFVLAPKTTNTSISYNLSAPEAAAAIQQFSFLDLEEKRQPLSQWKGKIMVLNFWATWCPPCRAEIPDFVKFQKAYASKGVQIVGIAIDQKSKVVDFAKEYKMNYPVLLGDLAGIDLAKRIGNKEGGLPYTVVVGQDGKIVATQLGAISYEKLQVTIEQLFN